VLNGHVGATTLAAWALLLVLLVPCRLLAGWLEGRIAITAGALLKRQLLQGALRLAPEEVRHQGAGQLLGRVLECEAIETLALTGGLLALVATAEAIVALPALANGAAPIAQPLLLAAWLALTLALARRYLRQRAGWSATRLAMTHDLVERMVGHRTRLAQQAPDRWHAGETEALEDYLRSSRTLDRSLVRLAAISPRGWLLGALAALAAQLHQGATSAEALAVSLGGTLLAFRALAVLATGLSHLAGAVSAWQQAAPLLHAAARPELRGSRTLADLRLPQDGSLRLAGHTPDELGSRTWRQLVAASPQFHENHVFLGSLAFNLLLGRRWPPQPRDLSSPKARAGSSG
jgi:ATP-binding cassette subfamily B protein